MATLKQKKAIKNVVENCGNVSKAMRDAGYSDKSAKNPKVLTTSKAYQELFEEAISNDDLIEKHKELLNATKLEHMVFTIATEDKEIKKLLLSVNCIVKKIQHGEQANHVWFWAKDNISIQKALDLAYKVKGNYSPEKIEQTTKLIVSDEDKELVKKVFEKNNL